MDGSVSNLAGRCLHLDTIAVGLVHKSVEEMREVESKIHSIRGSPLAPKSVEQSDQTCDEAADLYHSILSACLRSSQAAKCVHNDRARTARKLETLARGTALHALQTRRANILRVLTAQPEQAETVLHEWRAEGEVKQDEEQATDAHKQRSELYQHDEL